MDIKKLKLTTHSRFFAGIPVLGLAFFLPAGTLNYWEARLYLAILLIKLSYVYFLVTYLLPGFDRRFGWSHTPVLTQSCGIPCI